MTASQDTYTITEGVRARALFEGHDIADSKDVVMVRQEGHPAAYYFPRKDVFMVFLQRADKVARNPDKGEAHYFTIYRDQHIVDNVAWSYETPEPAFAAIADRIAFHPAHVEFQVEGHSAAEAQEDEGAEAD